MVQKVCVKVHILLATAVLGLLLLGPITPVTYAADCPTTTATGCSG